MGGVVESRKLDSRFEILDSTFSYSPARLLTIM
jgi:hypothetical protein